MSSLKASWVEELSVAKVSEARFGVFWLFVSRFQKKIRSMETITVSSNDGQDRRQSTEVMEEVSKMSSLGILSYFSLVLEGNP